MMQHQNRIISVLLVLIAIIDLPHTGASFWCDTDKYDCDRHSSGIAEKNAVSAPSPAAIPFPSPEDAPVPAPTPLLEDDGETIDSPEVIDDPDEGEYNPIEPPEIVDEPGLGEGASSAPKSDDNRDFPVLPFVAIAAGGGLLISLFFYLRRRKNPSDESAAEVDDPDVTP